MRPLPQLPMVFTTADALAAGITQEQAELATSKGHWRRLRRGAFCLAYTWDSASPEMRHVLLAEAVGRARQRLGRHASSHVTAAAAYRLPVAQARLERVMLTVHPSAERTPDTPRTT